MIDIAPWLMAMVVLIFGSGFFSASEAALFSLRIQDLKRFRQGSRGQQIAAQLLDNPDRLLSAVLFWNLVINMAFFAMASIISLHLERQNSRQWSIAFAIASLLTIIFFSEMLPKSIAVLSARRITPLMAAPLSVMVRLADPLMPALKFLRVVSQRLLWPRFEPETALEVADLERAVDLSSNDSEMVEQEQTAMRNIVGLSAIRADEWMRPRTQFRSFRPPVGRDDLRGEMTPSGYLLVTESDSEEISGAINLRRVSALPAQHLEHLARPAVIVPWCASVADALQKMSDGHGEIAAVVNEFGETIGILSFEDVLDTIFNYNPTRSDRILNRRAILEVGAEVWHVIGMTSLRRLARYFRVTLPPTLNVTVAGVIQEQLQRLPVSGDRCSWGPFEFRVLETPQRGHMLVELTRPSEQRSVP